MCNIYICIYTYIYMYMSTHTSHMYIYQYIYIYVYTHISICTCPLIHHTCTYITHKYTAPHEFARGTQAQFVCINIYTYIHIHTFTIDINIHVTCIYSTHKLHAYNTHFKQACITCTSRVHTRCTGLVCIYYIHTYTCIYTYTHTHISNMCMYNTHICNAPQESKRDV